MHSLFAWLRTRFSSVLSISFLRKTCGVEENIGFPNNSFPGTMTAFLGAQNQLETDRKEEILGQWGTICIQKSRLIMTGRFGGFICLLSIKHQRPLPPQTPPPVWNRLEPSGACFSNSRAAYIHVIGHSFLSPGSL